MPRPGFEECRRSSADELRSRDKNRADIVNPAVLVCGLDQRSGNLVGLTAILFDDIADFGGGQRIAEAVAAQQKRRRGMEGKRLDLDKIFVVRLSFARTYVAKNLVPPRVHHGLLHRQFAGVLLLADWRVIGGQLTDRSVPDEVQAGIANVADRHGILVGYRECQHAGHSIPVGVGLSQPADLVVRDGDRAPDLLLDLSAARIEFANDRLDRCFRGLLARRVPA